MNFMCMRLLLFFVFAEPPALVPVEKARKEKTVSHLFRLVTRDGEGGRNSIILVAFRLCYDQAVARNLIDQSVLPINSLRPPAGKLASQGLWLTLAAKGIPPSLLNQL